VFGEITSPVASSRKQFDRNETISQRIQNDDARNREICSARMQKNIVSTRSQGYPRVNDVTVNDKILGMIVQPCRIHTDMQKDDQLVTWKQISRKKINLQTDDLVNHNFSREFQLLDLDRLCNGEEENENGNKTEGDSRRLVAENNIIRTNDKDSKIDKIKNDDVTWLNNIQNLNQTYVIRDSEDIELLEIFYDKWKIKDSPRVEFHLKDRDEICEFDQKKLKKKTVTNNLKDKENEICEFDQKKLEMETVMNNLKDREDEICEFDQKKSKKKTIVNDKEIRIEQMKELKICIKDKEDNEIIMDRKTEELKTNDENMENIRKISEEVIEKELNISSREENKREESCKETKVTEYNIEKIEINIKDTKEAEKMDSANVAELDKLNVYKEDKKDQQIAMDKKIIENAEYIEETMQNLSQSDQLIKSSSFNAMHSTARNIELKEKNLVDQNQDYLNLKDDILQCDNNICCNNSLELKENIVTFMYDQPNINKPLSNSNDQVDCNSNPEDETTCQSNSYRNSLDLTENIQEISFPASCRIICLEKNCAKDAEEVKIDEERYENGLINIRNKKPKGNSKRLNLEVYSLPQNLEIAADNYLSAPINNIPLHIKNQQFQALGSDHFENIENNTKEEKADFNTNCDNSCLNDKSKLLGRSIIKTEVMTGEGLRNKNVDSEFDYGSDNTVREYNGRGANGLGSSVTDYAEEESQRRSNKIFLNASVNFPRRACAARRATRERPANSVEMKHRIRESMNLLRGSTDSLISSVEFVELASIRRPEANCAYERETIEIIRPNKRSKVFKDLPDIKSDAAETRGDSETSYWERTSKISRSRLTGLYPYHTEYKLTKRNPRVRILPVLNPLLINRR